MMVSGGARARSGPGAQPGSGRSDRVGREFRVLPQRPQRRKAPRFPLPPVLAVDAEDEDGRDGREAELWAWAWKQPQASVWFEQSWFHYLVAQWVRLSVICESDSAKAADRTAMIRLADQIGMTPAGMAQLGWVIESPGADSAPRSSKARQPRVASSRDRIGFQVIPGDGA